MTCLCILRANGWNMIWGNMLYLVLKIIIIINCWWDSLIWNFQCMGCIKIQFISLEGRCIFWHMKWNITLVSWSMFLLDICHVLTLLPGRYVWRGVMFGLVSSVGWFGEGSSWFFFFNIIIIIFTPMEIYGLIEL